ncbi:MAG: hypothetical protein QW315_06365 [Candidatus Hadarchaeum sp.]
MGFRQMDWDSNFSEYSLLGTLEKNRAVEKLERINSIERLWRLVKYEDVYIKKYETLRAAITGLTIYKGLHESFGYRTLYEVYYKYDRRINVAS